MELASDATHVRMGLAVSQELGVTVNRMPGSRVGQELRPMMEIAFQCGNLRLGLTSF